MGRDRRDNEREWLYINGFGTHSFRGRILGDLIVTYGRGACPRLTLHGSDAKGTRACGRVVAGRGAPFASCRGDIGFGYPSGNLHSPPSSRMCTTRLRPRRRGPRDASMKPPNRRCSHQTPCARDTSCTSSLKSTQFRSQLHFLLISHNSSLSVNL